MHPKEITAVVVKQKETKSQPQRQINKVSPEGMKKPAQASKVSRHH